MDLREILHQGMGWIQLPQDRVNMAMNFKIRVLLNQLSKYNNHKGNMFINFTLKLKNQGVLSCFIAKWFCSAI